MKGDLSLVTPRLMCNPYHEREFVSFIEFIAFIVPCDLPTPEGWEVDTRHDELVVVCPTAVSFPIALERWRWSVDSSSSHGQIGPFLVWSKPCRQKGNLAL